MLILNAGTVEYLSGNSAFLETSRSVFDVNFFGAIACIDCAMPLLKNSKQTPTIAGMSSMSSFTPLPRAEAYGSSKAALDYFLKSLRIDLASSGIRVVVISPGFVDTPMTRKNDFDMPWIWTTDEASNYITRKLARGILNIRFPWPMVLLMKLASCLPDKVYVRFAQHMVKN
jgi:NAD(P)-dependent dehydrogenase (short-subunit alcohol dehydrogenase family)